jgi:arylsulfatase A-like enzyme/alpha-L-fucosidase
MKKKTKEQKGFFKYCLKKLPKVFMTCSVAVSGCMAEESARKPNIIFILADDMGYGDIQRLNTESKIPTPHINRLCDEGMYFTDAHSNAAVSTPTRYGIITGRYCFRSSLKKGVLNGYSRPLIETDRPTVASVLKNNGYHTACIGKWHLGLGWNTPESAGNASGDSVDFTRPLSFTPNDAGFDDSYILPASLDMPPYVYIDNRNVTDTQMTEIQKNSSPRGLFWREGKASKSFSISNCLDHFTDKAKQYIAAHALDKQPFFLYFPLTAPHTPWLPDERFRGVSGAGTYGDFVAHVDDVIGQIVATLDSLGIVNETMIVFTSDNGADWKEEDKNKYPHKANYIWRGRKSDAWDAGHHVPLIVKYPAAVARGTCSDALVCLTDMFATFANMTAAPIPEGAAEDSRSFLATLYGKSNTARTEIVHHSINGMFALRKGKWKLVNCSGSGGWSEADSDSLPPVQLYDMETDPNETLNLYHRYPYKVEELKKLLDSVIVSNLPASPQGKGDEQGLEIGRLDLHQDSIAIEEAFNGWWTDSQKTLEQRMEWFTQARFGCFIHWGVYSMAGGEWNGKAVSGYAEHIMRSQKIPLEEYKERLVKPFNPTAFDADEWIRQARDAGMRYFIITAKHHDGFAMYFSDAYPYDMRMTRFNCDPMKELRDAARKYGVKFGFYYSHAFDWEHPHAPGNDWDYDNPGGDKLLHGKNWWLDYPTFLKRTEQYLNEKSIPQIQELIRNYQPDILWFDTPQKLPLYENIRILKIIRETAPETLVINGRLVRFSAFNLGDYVNTGDRAAYFSPVKSKYWEAIPTTNESYGYSKYDRSHKPASHFIRLLASAVSKGGNILMNVGPMGNGKWDETDIKILKETGQWLKKNGEAIYGTLSTDIPVQNWGVTTKKDNRLYLHIFHYPKDAKLIAGGLSADVERAYLLDGGETVTCLPLGNRDMLLSLPEHCPDTANSVVVLQLKNTDYAVEKNRLLIPGERNELLVFDAQLSKGLGVGDGKQFRNYVQNWKNSEQYIRWDVRLAKPASFRLTLEYNKEKPTDSGTVVVEIDGKPCKASYASGDRTLNLESLPFADIHLDTGEHAIVLKGESFQGEQFMRPMQILLE